jgi:hypothetical protein
MTDVTPVDLRITKNCSARWDVRRCSACTVPLQQIGSALRPNTSRARQLVRGIAA